MPKGSWRLSAFFAVCTLLPQVLVISNERLLVRMGAYRTLVFSLQLSMIASPILYVLSASPYSIILFMVLDSVLAHSTSPLFNILFSEFIEDDTVRNSRRYAALSIWVNDADNTFKEHNVVADIQSQRATHKASRINSAGDYRILVEWKWI